MTTLKIKTYKMRALVFAYTQRCVGFLLQIPIPPKVSAGCFIERDGKLLVLDLTYRSGYAFPGGLIEPNENIEQGLKREVFEETGLQLSSIQYIGSKEDTQYGISVVALAFSGVVKGNIQESDEGSLHWLDPETIKENQAYQNWNHLLDLYLQA